MLKMATSDVLSGPVRLLFPHAIAPGTHPAFPFSLVGMSKQSLMLAQLALARGHMPKLLAASFSISSHRSNNTHRAERLAFSLPNKPQVPLHDRHAPFAGLGDIAVPGLLVALSLRFDAHLGQGTEGSQSGIASLPTSKPYFWTAMVCTQSAATTAAACLRPHCAVWQPVLLDQQCCMHSHMLTWADAHLKQSWHCRLRIWLAFYWRFQLDYGQMRASLPSCILSPVCLWLWGL